MTRSKTLAKILMLFAMLVCAAAPLNCAKVSGSKGKANPAAAKKTAAKKSAAPVSAVADPGVPAVLELGQPAPELNTKDAGGRPVRLADYKGRVVVVTFWDISSDICKKQIRDLEIGLAKKKADAVVLAVTQLGSDEKNRAAAASLKKSDIKALALFDVNNDSSEAYQITGVPYFAVIDKAGRLQGAGVYDVGLKMNTMNFIDVAITLAAGGKVPDCEFADTKMPAQYAKYAGKDAPNFKLLDLDGNEESPLFYKGFSNLLLVFWSPACPHCRRELPRLMSFARKNAKRLNLKIISVVSTPEKDDQNFNQLVTMARQVAVQDKLSFPVVLDIGMKQRVAYNVEGVPTLIYIGMSGKIEHAWRGESLFTGENIDCAVGKGR